MDVAEIGVRLDWPYNPATHGIVSTTGRLLKVLNARLQSKLDLQIRYGPLIREQCRIYGIPHQLPDSQEIREAVRWPGTDQLLLYTLLQTEIELNVHQLRDEMYKASRRPADARLLLHFAKRFSPEQMPYDMIIGAGGHFVEGGQTCFPTLVPENDGWVMKALPFPKLEPGNNIVFLAWS